MRPKERFLAALMRTPVDRVPLFDFLFQRPLYAEVIGRAPEAYNARDAMDLTVALGLDAVWIPFGCFSGCTPEELSENVYKDEWGTTFQKNDSSWPLDAPIAYPLKDREDLVHYTPPDPAAPGRLDEIDTALAINNKLGDNAVAILGGVNGPLTICWMLMGYERICISLFEDPKFLAQAAQIGVDFALGAVARMAKAGVDGIIIAEDLGASSTGLLHPAQFRGIFKPGLAKIIQAIQECGLPAILHSCGRIHPYLDDVVELGIHALHPLQRTAGMDLANIKKEYGNRICIIGNIDSSRTLPHGSPEDVEQETIQALRLGAPGYGYILASDHSLHDGIPVANILRMFDVARKYGVYPAVAADPSSATS